MPDFRSYCPNLNPNVPRITLSADESHHLISVNRARQGDPVVIFDGFGNEWASEITIANKREAVLEGKAFNRYSPPLQRIALAQSIPKSKGLENIIRKATELGIQDIYPLISNRTETKIRDGKEKTKNEKWLGAAIEGAKQSGNPFIPTIHATQRLDLFLEKESGNFQLKLIASLEEGSTTLHGQIEQAVLNPNASGIFLVGPEGDFTETEYDQIRQVDFLPVSLGPYVLKCETAAVKALSILQHEFFKWAP